jgi:serine/threonine protein phosphatase PrpC
MTKIDYAAASSVGKVRGNNEDNFYANGKTLSDSGGEPLPLCGTADGFGCFAVCDGMGGAEFGEVASDIAVRELARREVPPGGAAEDWCRAYAEAANDKICAEIKARDGIRMGTTLALLVIGGGKATVCNIGDSRVYLARDGQMTQLSADHTQMRRMIDNGVLTPEKAKTHPDRHKLTQHLGIFPRELLIEPYIAAGMPVKNGDIFLLCSDGLTDMLSDAEIAGILLQNNAPGEAAAELVRAALQNGGKDNVTVIVARTDAESGFWKRILG